MRGIDREQAADADEREWHDLEDGRRELHASRGADADCVHGGEQTDDADRQQRRRRGGADGGGQERIEIPDERDGERRLGRPDRDPVSPRDEKAGEIAERLARVRVGTAGRRIDAGETGEDQREQHRTGRRDAPADESEAAVRRERRRQQEDARPDHVAHDERDSGPEPEHAARRGGRHRPDGHRRARCYHGDRRFPWWMIGWWGRGSRPGGHAAAGDRQRGAGPWVKSSTGSRRQASV